MTRQLGYQVEIFNKKEALGYFKSSNYEDCRIKIVAITGINNNNMNNDGSSFLENSTFVNKVIV